MDEELVISTPEQVAFHYETAGIGSRFVASLLDHLIIGVALFLVLCAAAGIGVTSFGAGIGGNEGTEFGLNLVSAILVLVFFLIFWGYFVLFEIVWQGSTPGKRAGKLRVLRLNGQPIGATEAIVRNLVRLVDFLPGFYGIGLLVMFLDKNARRLGDFAAGTIVVREGEQTRLRDVRVPEPAPAYNPYAYPMPQHETHLAAHHTPASTRPDPLPGVSLHGVTADDYRLMRELTERVSRGELQWARGQDLAARLAYGVASRMGHDFREWQARGWDPLTFLQSVLNSRDARGE